MYSYRYKAWLLQNKLNYQTSASSQMLWCWTFYFRNHTHTFPLCYAEIAHQFPHLPPLHLSKVGNWVKNSTTVVTVASLATSQKRLILRLKNDCLWGWLCNGWMTQAPCSNGKHPRGHTLLWETRWLKSWSWWYGCYCVAVEAQRSVGQVWPLVLQMSPDNWIHCMQLK